MKTPDKIKKGLECCNGKWVGTHFRGCDSECPYYSEQPFCKNVRNHDTLAYIQQLERERDAAVEACGKFPCESCAESENGDNCNWCAVVNGRRTGYVWRGVKDTRTGASDSCTGASGV